MDLQDSTQDHLRAASFRAADELHYILSDLGATFGKTGGFMTHNRNAPKDFVKSKFVTGMDGSNVKFGYSGKNGGLMKGITIADVKWIGGLLSKLSDQQITDAFRAANFSPEDTQMLAQAVRERINQLTSLTQGPGIIAR